MLGIVSRAGTARIESSPKNSQIKALLKKLNDLQCDIEGAAKKRVAVDVLPHADIHKGCAVLQKAEQTWIIDFEEGHCGHPVGSKPQ